MKKERHWINTLSTQLKNLGLNKYKFARRNNEDRVNGNWQENEIKCSHGLQGGQKNTGYSVIYSVI